VERAAEASVPGFGGVLGPVVHLSAADLVGQLTGAVVVAADRPHRGYPAWEWRRHRPAGAPVREPGHLAGTPAEQAVHEHHGKFVRHPAPPRRPRGTPDRGSAQPSTTGEMKTGSSQSVAGLVSEGLRFPTNVVSCGSRNSEESPDDAPLRE